MRLNLIRTCYCDIIVSKVIYRRLIIAAKIIDEFTNAGLTGNQRWKRRHPEQTKQSDKERRQRYVLKNPLRALLKNVKSRAKKKGLVFSITSSDFPNGVPKICPVLGLEMHRNSKKGWHDKSPTVDRIDSSKGYIPGNVRIISWRANDVKGNATITELEKVLDYVKKEYVLRAD